MTLPLLLWILLPVTVIARSRPKGGDVAIC